MVAKYLKYQSKNLHDLADIFKILNKTCGKIGDIVIPVFNLDCVPSKKFDRKNSLAKWNVWKFTIKKYYKYRTKHPMYSFLVFGKKSKKYMKVNNGNATGPDSLWKKFLMMIDLT